MGIHPQAIADLHQLFAKNFIVDLFPVCLYLKIVKNNFITHKAEFTCLRVLYYNMIIILLLTV